LGVGPSLLPFTLFISETTRAKSNLDYKKCRKVVSKGICRKKIRLEIIIINFGCWPHFAPLYILQETVTAIKNLLTFYINICIRNIKKNTSSRLVEI
jgi:hypothetical protein